MVAYWTHSNSLALYASEYAQSAEDSEAPGKKTDGEEVEEL
jgi:hypothetical protein